MCRRRETLLQSKQQLSLLLLHFFYTIFSNDFSAIHHRWFNIYGWLPFVLKIYGANYILMSILSHSWIRSGQISDESVALALALLFHFCANSISFKAVLCSVLSMNHLQIHLNIFDCQTTSFPQIVFHPSVKTRAKCENKRKANTF